MRICALTTKDNPWNPFTNFKEWMTFDITYNYNCSERLARVARTSDALTAEENNEEIRRAIAKIIANDPLNIYTIVESEEDEPKPDKLDS